MVVRLVTHPSFRKILFTALPLAVIMSTIFLVDIQKLRDIVEDAGVWAPLILILAKILSIVIAPFSGGPLYILSGSFFGFWSGLFYTLIGDFFGYSIAFWISRKFGRSTVEQLISKKKSGLLSQIIDQISTVRGFAIAVIIFCLMPELVAYGAGLSKLSYWKFITIMLTILTPGTIVIVYASTLLAK